MKKIIRVLKLILTADTNDKSFKYTGTVSLIFAAVSCALTVMNIIKQYQFMSFLTAFLVVGFIISAIFAAKNKFLISHIIIAVLCVIVFSVFAVTGGNNGFAILWIVLIPIISYMLVGLRIGFYLSLYFQVFLAVLFYTPLSDYVKSFYTPTFIARFPILYFAAFASVTLLYCEHQKLYILTHRQAFYDSLTNMYNRRKYNDVIEQIKTDHKSVSFINMDINLLKYTNDNLGHLAGDELISSAASLILNSFDKDMCFRIGGDEFAVISSRSKAEIEKSLSDFSDQMKEWRGDSVKSINISYGCAYAEENPGKNIDELYIIADEKMYMAKNRFHEKCSVAQTARNRETIKNGG